MLHLKTFGGLSVETGGAPGTGAAQQRKTLALLALVATAGRRGISRDKLTAYLWPESDAEHGRSLLKQACYALRRDLEAHQLFLGTLQLRLNPDIMTSDVHHFEAALERGDPAQAVALYPGPFLDGFYLGEAGAFERWVEEERARLVKRASEALESLATQAVSAGDLAAAVKWRRRLAELDRLSSRAALGLMNALVAAGDRAAALEFGRAHETLLRQELGAAPEPAVSALLERLRVAGPQPVAIASDAAASSDARGPSVASARASLRTARFGWRLAFGATAIVLVGGAIISSARRPKALDPELLAVAPFQALDPRVAPWREGLVDVLARNLDGAIGLRTVSPSVSIRGWQGRADPASAEQLGRRTGAGLVLFGEFSRAGPDSVRLRAGLLDGRQGHVVAEFERTESADRIDRLADSVSLDVMRALVPTNSWVSSRLRSPGTRSLPALKAFLDGERYARRYSLDSAIASYERAIVLDATYALARRGLGLARSWNLQPAPELTRAGALNHGLSPRDSLLVASDSQQTGPSDPAFYRLVHRREVVLTDAIGRFFEDPEVWHEVGETQYHVGFVWPDNLWNRARTSFDRAIALDSGFAIAYVHALEIALSENDPEAALRYARGYLAVPSMNPTGGGMYLLALALDPRKARPHEFDRKLETASLVTLWRVALAIRSWPDTAETQLAVSRRLVATAADQPAYDLRLFQSLLGTALIFRGHLQEARGVVGNRLVMTQFMELAQMGAIPADTVETALSPGVREPDAGDRLAFPWVMEGPCYRTLDAALWWASRRDTASLQRMVRREDSLTRTIDRAVVGPAARPVPAFARAALTLARGDTTIALRRFLAVPDSSCPGARQRREIQFRLLAAVGRDSEAAWVWERLYDRRVPLLLDRARLADHMGDRPTAIHYYQFVLQAWLHADPELQPYVSEARAALTRLGGAPR